MTAPPVEHAAQHARVALLHDLDVETAEWVEHAARQLSSNEPMAPWVDPDVAVAVAQLRGIGLAGNYNALSVVLADYMAGLARGIVAILDGAGNTGSAVGGPDDHPIGHGLAEAWANVDVFRTMAND